MEKKLPLLFDLDGTLWDAREGIAEAWNEVSLRHFGIGGIDVERVTSLMGMQMDDIVEALSPFKASKEAKENFGKEAFEYENHYLSKKPGKVYLQVEETIQTLKERGYQVYIVSNCQKGYIENFLNIVKPGLFDDYLCFGDTNGPKSLTIKTILKKHGFEKGIYIGDTAGDEKATREAGCDFVYASYGFGKAISPDYVIKTFVDLLSIFE